MYFHQIVKSVGMKLVLRYYTFIPIFRYSFIFSCIQNAKSMLQSSKTKNPAKTYHYFLTKLSILNQNDRGKVNIDKKI